MFYDSAGPAALLQQQKDQPSMKCLINRLACGVPSPARSVSIAVTQHKRSDPKPDKPSCCHTVPAALGLLTTVQQ